MVIGGAAAFSVYVASAGVTASAQLLIARIVGAHTYGVYAYVIAWITILAYFCALGFDIALLRFVSAYQTMGASGLARGVIQYAERRSLGISLLVALIGACIIEIWPRPFSTELTNTFLVGFVLIPLLALLWIRCSIVRAFGGVVPALIPDRVMRDGLLVIIVVVAGLFFGSRMQAQGIMMASVAGAVVGLVLASRAVRRLCPDAISAAEPQYAPATWRQTAIPFMIIAGAEALLNRAGVVLLGWFGETREAGIYSLVFNIAFLVALPRTAINTLFAPTISSLFTKNDRVTLQALVTKAALWTLCTSVAIALGLAIVAEPLLAWFGRDFVAGASALRILLLGQVVAAAFGSLLLLMTMTEHEWGAAVLLTLSAAFNILASIAFIYWLGLTGAAIASSAALIIWHIAMAFFTFRHLRLLPGFLGLFASNRKEEAPAKDEAPARPDVRVKPEVRVKASV
ncbi:oligosaccharide flippase family protein [Bradyrhizobium sp. CIAT3101]|uniref:oligosaccharide flippase family protein n=1 Tax=Bradyrhizobium sp. CIAT3101 TaxID=439387 RepID=UPI0024B0B672|nr:oligosaccharide flippase family protein [Bradyrhizobium sp. CIAT3101]WFU78301.1 oligosaccharide flippase family protein [Bradyrhizobium sp. CIAT3101]